MGAGPDVEADLIGSISPTPVWLLDVDGVLNADRPGWGAAPRRADLQVGPHSYRMRWAPALIEAIVRLRRTTSVEIRWATTWVDEIHQVARAMRLPDLPVAFGGLGGDPSQASPEAKLQAALHVLEVENRPLIWTDDDAIPALGPDARRLRDARQPSLLISPNPKVGLQAPDLAAIAEFLADSYDR
jgi:hypothetical protein